MRPISSSSPKWAYALGGFVTLLILLIAIGTYMWESGIYAIFGDALGSKIEGAVISGGLYLAVPLGLIDIGAGRTVLSRSASGRNLGLLFIAVGMIGIFAGVFWWWGALQS